MKGIDKALFISDNLFIEQNSKFTGGVKLCTLEYISLVNKIFECRIASIENNISLLSKIKIKLKIDVYDFYDRTDLSEIEQLIQIEKFEWVVLNMSNLIGIAKKLKLKLPNIRVILLSHGNESGDYMHDITRFNKSKPNFFQAFKIGSLLIKESYSRLNFIDYVFTVSEVESNIEKWLNAKKVIFIPRAIDCNFLEVKPIVKRIGFIGDLSHAPNYDAVLRLCKAFEEKSILDFELRLIGKPFHIGNMIQAKYKFVKYLGVLTDIEVEAEVVTWAAFLNLLFYYSRGVSTKLGFALIRGLPVITTTIGTRGYKFKSDQNLMMSDQVGQICKLIVENCSNLSKVNNLIAVSRNVALTSITLDEIAASVKHQL